MDDQSAAVRPEMPLVPRDATGGTGSAPIDDPRALTILSTEQYSLLTARSLVDNEAFAHAGMSRALLPARSPS